MSIEERFQRERDINELVDLQVSLCVSVMFLCQREADLKRRRRSVRVCQCSRRWRSLVTCEGRCWLREQDCLVMCDVI